MSPRRGVRFPARTAIEQNGTIGSTTVRQRPPGTRAGCRYQAFNAKIAAWAVEHQRFGGPHFKEDRMTWIKTNFLWMM